MVYTKNRKNFEWLAHIVSWTLLFLFPVLLSYSGDLISRPSPIHHIALYASYLILFYANYIFLVDKFFFRRRTKLFILLNILLIILVCFTLQVIHETDWLWRVVPQNLDVEKERPPRLGKIVDDLLAMVMVVSLALIVKTIGRWKELENRNRELEKKRVDAELHNLKQQLNPHFVFNTLNNIYALIAIDGEKARQAVLEMSNLLRYVLYENKERYVPVEQEINFICYYIELMRLRQSSNMQFSFSCRAQACYNHKIAPLLFIPLIENAFKHSINPVGDSFIKIVIEACDSNTLMCKVENSCFPKGECDKSGSGVGLENLTQRLLLLYPDRHTLQFDITREVYSVMLVINL